jgi:AraC family transcriptional regulator
MTAAAYSSFAQWYRTGHLANYVRTMNSAGGIINLLEAAQPAGDMSDPAVPDIVLYQDLNGNCRVSGDMGGGHFDVQSTKSSFYLSAPNFASTVIVDSAHELRSVAFPLAQWQTLLDDTTDGRSSLDYERFSRGAFESPIIRSTISKLWALCEAEGAPSRLLARAAGCEILAELCQLGGAPFRPAKGGLATWAEQRSIDLMRSRLNEDISLDELAAEARLSPFHFARMFKQSIGVPPRAYLTRLRIEKACELLEKTDLPVTEIALQVGYSSNQVLARVFSSHMRSSPSDYRRAVRDPVRAVAQW